MCESLSGGKVFIICTSGHTLHDENKNTIGAFIIFRDITENVIKELDPEKKNEKPVMQSEALLKEIEDSVPKIDPENRQKIFKPFYTTKSSGKGTVLGLSVSRKIIRDHYGKWTADKAGPDPS